MTGTISLLTTGFTGDYFIQPHASDYYIGKKEDRGIWFGKGATRFGLSGSVGAKELERLLAGCHPKTGKSLVKTKPEHRVPGVDITFSVPKSVSAYAIVAGEERRSVVIECILESVRRTLTLAEDTLPLVRLGKDGIQQQKGEITAALFPHFTNRSGDPQLHVHSVISNLAWDGQSRFVGINTMELFDWTRTLGPIFRTFLAQLLRDRLNLDLFIPTDSRGESQSWFEIRGVSKSLCDTWSSRSKEIEEYLADDLALGNVTSYDKREATKATRQDKEKLPPINELVKRWEDDIRKSGFTIDQVPLVTSRPAPEQITEAFNKAIVESASVLLEGNATFTAKQVLQFVVERLQHLGTSPRFLLDQVNRALGDQRSWIHLEKTGWRRTLTTPEMWKLEGKLLDHASVLRERPGVRVREKVVREILAAKPELSEEQQTVLRDLTQRRNGLRILEGVAGSGKTTVLDSVREAFERSGRRVIGGSLSGLATQNLAEGAQVSSRTVASYLHHLDKPLMLKAVDRILHDLKQMARAAMDKPTRKHDPVRIPKRGVLILDEAGMIDTKSMERLLYHARKAKATVILVGDRKQLQPIAAGGPFRFLADKYAHVSLTQNRRQRDKDDQIAVKEVRDGFTKQALESYLRRDLLKVTESRSDSAKQIAKAWLDQGGHLTPQNHIILTETRREARVLNRICQEARLGSGQINRDTKIQIDKCDLYTGDRVLFTKPMRLRGIENGSRGTIVKTDPKKEQITLLLDQPKKGYPSTVVLSTDAVSGGRISLAYAGTVHKLQGQSTENAYVLLGGGMTDNNMAYTQLTRARGVTRIFVDKVAAGEELRRISKRISREQAKTLAQDRRTHNNQEIDR